MEFSQCANVETSTPTELTGLALFPVSENKASAEQWVELKGTSGTIENYAANAAGDIYSDVKINFTNSCDKTGTLTLVLPGWSEVESNGDVDTEASFLLTHKSGKLDCFGVYAETQDDSDFTHKSVFILNTNTAFASSDEYHSNAWVIP